MENNGKIYASTTIYEKFLSDGCWHSIHIVRFAGKIIGAYGLQVLASTGEIIHEYPIELSWFANLTFR